MCIKSVTKFHENLYYVPIKLRTDNVCKASIKSLEENLL